MSKYFAYEYTVILLSCYFQGLDSEEAPDPNLMKRYA